MCSMPCLCAQIYMLVAMPCASIALLSLDISLSCVLALIGGVQIQILWSRPTSAHLRLYRKVWIYVCLLASMLYAYVCLSRSRLCHALYPLWDCACRSLRSLTCVVASIPPRVYLHIATREIHLRGVSVLDSHISLLCATLYACLALLCATRVAFFASMHSFCMLAYMFKHDSVCRPYSNPMELWTLDSKLHYENHKAFKDHCMVQLGLLLKQDPRRSKKHLMG